MTLGELLKQRRAELGLSQAALAEKMGIEQSYLSKLESDRSLPSEDIYDGWLASLNTDTDSLMHSIPHSAIKGKLRKVPAIKAWMESQNHISSKQRFVWALSCVLLVSLAVPAFYLGYTKTLFSEKVYSYQSDGIVLPGENAEIFKNWPETIVVNNSNRTLRHEKQAEMAQRTDPVSVMLPRSRGFLFNEPVEGLEGHSRTYYANGTHNIPKPVNGWLQAIGLFLFVFGVLGLIFQKRFIGGNENNW